MLNYQNENWDEPHLTHRDFTAFFEATKQAMFVENRDGYVVSINAAACELWGTSFKDLIGKHASEVLPPRMDTSSPGKIRRSRYTRPDDTTVEVEVLSTPLTLGDDEAFLTTVWPVPDEVVEEGGQAELAAAPADSDSRKEAHATKMEALARLSERLSHDFNNILTSIIGFSSLMRADESIGETNRSYLEQIAEATARAEIMTAELRSFGRMLTPPSSSFHLAEAIDKIDARIREILPSRITLTTICEDDVAPIPGDEATLTEILLQLATNAREAMEGAAEGELKIELGSDDSGGTTLRVSDDGPGMDELSIAAAFEPFFTSRSDEKMRGLGLARVFAATRNLGGTVALSSEQGKGTQLDFSFPPAGEPAPPAPTAEPIREPLPALDTPDAAEKSVESDQPVALPKLPVAPAPASKEKAKPRNKRSKLPGGSETILVVEDEPMVREIVVRSLTHLGYTVHKACDGEEGLQLSRELDDEVDLIFSDIVMPRLSGPEMVQRIRDESRETPVLFTTGFTESKHLLENGGDLRDGIDLLQKPYTPNVLAERVREKLDSLAS